MKTNKKIIWIVSILVLVGLGFLLFPREGVEQEDDWIYDSSISIGDRISSISQGIGATKSFGAAPAMEASAGTIGLAAGGAKDVANFRENINNDYLPLPTDITYEGLFYDYYFDTGDTEVCEKLFCPSYSYSITADPFSSEDEYYLSVGLNSGIKESDFKRKKLNLIVVLDISGSMSSSFSKYYYDRFGRRINLSEEEVEVGKSKMEVAAKSVVSLLDHLNDDDRFGMVLFDDQAYLAKPLGEIGDLQTLKDHILEIEARGGTRMSAGMKLGTELFSELGEVDASEYENRIIFLTDAMPNLGDTSEEGLFSITSSNADNKIYTTFIGIGVDFNTELVEILTKIRGANYYSVHSSKEFQERMDDEFEYMVTPLVFNLMLELDADGYEIEKVYGSPEANEATGELMKVNTLFPSKREEEEVRGGIVILKLKKLSDNATLSLKASYEDREGNLDSDTASIEFGDEEADYFENNGIRKAILLSRYADLMKNWIIDERGSYDNEEPIEPAVWRETGIVVPPPIDYELGRWERQSIPLMVSSHFKDLFEEFSLYFESEMDAIGDETLEQESDILKKLISVEE